MDSEQDKPDAIIYIPGVDQKPGLALDEAALRISSALDMGARTASAEFQLEAGQEEDYIFHEGKSLKTRVRRIRRTEPNKQPTQVADIYEFGYVDSLTKGYVERNVLVKGFRLLIVLVRNIPRTVEAFRRDRRQKTAREKLQFIIATLILSLLVVYLVILGKAVVDTVLQARQVIVSQPSGASNIATDDAAEQDSANSNPPAATATDDAAEQDSANSNPPAATATDDAAEQDPANSSPPADTWPTLTISQLFIIIVAAIEVFYPNIRQSFIDAAGRYISMIEYFDVGARHNAVGGQLLALLDHVAAHGYRHIHIIAYSFGTVIALDNLFPSGRIPTERVQDVHTLVTIGCPFDLIRVFWPSYFTERSAVPEIPKSWINVYSPIDVMASNFRNDSKIGDADPQQALTASAGDSTIKLIPSTNVVFESGRPKRTLSFFDLLTLVGLEAHATYWESEFEAEITAFSPVIAGIYKDDSPLE